MLRGTLASGALLLLAPILAVAHEGVDETIRQVDRDVAARPSDAAARFRRAELHRLRGDLARAREDYAAARRIDPGLHVVELGIARAELATEPAASLAAAEGYLLCVPGSLEGHRVRARALEALGRADEALAARERVLDLAIPPREPEPDDYLERARLLAAAGHAPAAIACLEAGLGRLGRAIALDLAALELEVGSGRRDAALARIRTIAAGAGRKESWQLREAKLLEEAGRRAEARRSYESALASLAIVPAARRAAPAARELEREIRDGLARLVPAP